MSENNENMQTEQGLPAGQIEREPAKIFTKGVNIHNLGEDGLAQVADLLIGVAGISLQQKSTVFPEDLEIARDNASDIRKQWLETPLKEKKEIFYKVAELLGQEASNENLEVMVNYAFQSNAWMNLFWKAVERFEASPPKE